MPLEWIMHNKIFLIKNKRKQDENFVWIAKNFQLFVFIGSVKILIVGKDTVFPLVIIQS